MIPYGLDPSGIEWGTQQPVFEHDPEGQIFNWAAGTSLLGVSAGALALYSAKDFNFGGSETFLTSIYKGISLLEHFTPVQMAATFRLGSILSPLVQQEKVSLAADGNIINLGRDFLGKHTTSYLSKITGLSEVEVLSRGGAENLFWERTGKFTGKLFSQVDETKKLISENIGLLNARDIRAKGLNPFVQAYISTLDEDLAASIKGKGPKLVSSTEAAIKQFYGVTDPSVSDFIPIGPGKVRPELQAFLHGIPENKVAGVLTTARHIRAIPAFALQRTNRLIQEITAPIPALQRFLSIKDGPALTTLGRYAGKIGQIGAAYLALEQLDWMKRQDGITSILASGGYGAAAGFISKRYFGSSSKASAITGMATAALTMTGTFQEGVIPGLATVATSLNMARARFSNLPGLKYMPGFGHEYRAYMDEVMPGVSNPTTAVFAGLVGGSILTHLAWKKTGTKLTSKYVDWKEEMIRLGHEWNKPFAGPVMSASDLPKAWYNAASEAISRVSHNVDYAQLPEHKRLQRDIDEKIAKTISNSGGFFSKAGAQIRGALIHGGSSDVDAILGSVQNFKRSIPLTQGQLRFAIPGLAFALLTGGFASKETPQELEDIYSGKKLVPMRKSRWWEGGSTPFEGKDIASFIPHWYKRLTSRAEDKSKWGAEEDSISPISKFFLENFTYELEKKNYWTRPYPITGEALSGVPIIGPLLGPIGRLIKPARLMHVDEWTRPTLGGGEGEVELASQRSGLHTEPQYELGGLKPGTPVSPFSPRAQLSQVQSQLQDLSGVVGWTHGLWTKAVGGTSNFYSEDRWLEPASRMSSFTRDFWEENLGGFAGISEPIRRFFPKISSEREWVNPIRNQMPSWLPNMFKYGDPIGRLDHGETLLPGPGFEALHPELRGLSPENYPLPYKYDILANLAPWSASFRSVANMLQSQISKGVLPQQDLEYINSINDRLRLQAERRNFLPGIGDWNKQTEDWGMTSKFLGGMYRGILSTAKNIAQPLEYPVFPIGLRPFSKLLPFGTAVDEYERNNVYGTSNSFWDKPWRDYFRPALYTASHNWGGWDGIPMHVQEGRNMSEYFDKLEHRKWTDKANEAEARGNEQKAVAYRKLASQTIEGVNPYGSTRDIYSILPYEERDYFNSFRKETDSRSRERILHMVPEYMKRIYTSQWEMLDASAGRLDQETGSLQMRKQAAESQRQANLSNYWATNPMPRPDWTGWSDAVDLEDVKMKVVQQTGSDIHDYNLWEGQATMMKRKPYLANIPTNNLYSSHMESGIYGLLQEYGITGARIEVNQFSSFDNRSDINVRYRDTREYERNSFMSIFGD